MTIIEFTKILECRPKCDGGAEHQGHEDDDVNYRRNDVLDTRDSSKLSYRCLSIRYNNGNK